MPDPQEIYKERRAELVKIRADSLDSFDKAVLQLSTGTLVITVTFLDKIGKPYDALTNWLLLLSWICFILVIIGNLLSFYFARKNMDFKITDLNRRVKEHQEKWLDSDEQFSNYKKATEFCNQAVLFVFLIGTVFFLTYAGLIQHKQYQEATRKPKKEVIMSEKKRIDEGATEAPEFGWGKKGQTESPEQVIINDHPTVVVVNPPKGKDK